MPAAKRIRMRPLRRQRGVSAVEFALLAVVFCTAVFGIVEVARMLFVFNTLQEVTRRAAAAAVHVYPTDSDGIAALRRAAVFRKDSGGLLLAAPVSDASLRIDYLALTRDPGSLALTMTEIKTSALPNSAARNRQVCMGNPNADNCIRLVRVSVCSAATVTSGGADCKAPTSQMLVPMVGMSIRLHKATTIAPVESFGYRPGDSPCPCT